MWVDALRQSLGDYCAVIAANGYGMRSGVAMRARRGIGD